MIRTIGRYTQYTSEDYKVDLIHNMRYNKDPAVNHLEN